jgi:hypothetical protein
MSMLGPHFAGGDVAGKGKRRWVIGIVSAVAVAAATWALAAADDLMRFTRNVPGDSKPIVLHADEMATWVEGGQRIILMRGKVLVDNGVVEVRAERAVGWVDLENRRQTGILRLVLYAEQTVTLENGPNSRSGPQGLIELNTRGELKLRSTNSKVVQQPQPNDPDYRRAIEVRTAPAKPASAGTVTRQANYQDPAPATTPSPALGQLQPLVPPPSFPPTAPAGPPTTTPGGAAGAPSAGQPPAGSVPGVRPSQIPLPQASPPRNGPAAFPGGPNRQFTVQPRTSEGFDPKSFPLPNGEHVVVVNGGVILLVKTATGNGLLDIEADRLVFWTRGNPNEMMNKMRSSEGQKSNEMEFFLAGNVVILSQSGQEVRRLQADEVYYDVGRNVAVAMHADLEFKQPGIQEPIHLKAEEMLKLSEDKYRGLKAEIFSSKLPSDPGLKIYVREASIESKEIPKKSIFGAQVLDQNGRPEIEHQRLVDSRDVLLKIEDIPVFYLPFLRGDANDPLGPLESVTFNYNRIFGFTAGASLNVFDLLGIDPRPNTRWRFDVDYLTQRGPALGTEFDYANKTFLGLPAIEIGRIRAYGIDDHGTDILGGNRDGYPHPELRGRFAWLENVQNLPEGFTFQALGSAISDKNYYEQYFKNEFNTDIDQQTFAYLKQQQNQWAWTLLGSVQDRNWVTETSWLPEASGYLIGQSLFDVFTYNAQASAGYAILTPTHQPPPPVEITDKATDTARLDLRQELSLPFYLGPIRMAPYAVLEGTYYSEDLTGSERGRLYEGGGVRASIPFTRLYPDVHSDLLNLNGINHKIIFSGNFFYAHSDTNFTRLPQLDQLNDNATDQSLRDIKPVEPLYNPQHGLALEFSPVYDPQLYAIRRLVDNRVDTLDSIEVFQFDIFQRWQTKRGFPGQQHIVDWMTLDLSGSYFPQSSQNFGSNFAFLQYDWTWNIGDRTTLLSSGWYDPETNGPRVFSIGAFLNRPDRTSFFIGYRQIDPLNSQAVTGSITYIFSPKYALTASTTYDFGTSVQSNSLQLTRMGSDLQVNLGFSYNSTTSSFGVTFEIIPNILPPNKRIPGLSALGPNTLPR